MEIQGTVVKILPPVQGTSQRTGNPWTAQSFVIEVRTGEHGQYTKKQVYEIFGEDKIKEAQLFEGKQVRVSFDIEAREHEGRWYNSVRAWKVESVGAQVSVQNPYQPIGQYPPPRQQPPQPNTGYFQPQGYGQQPNTGYYQTLPPQQQQGGDLPF